MPQYRYSARDAEGKLVEGMVDSVNRAAALLRIEQNHCVPISIDAVSPAAGAVPATVRESPASGPAPAGHGPVRTLPMVEQFLFTEQLAHLLSAGMTLDEALAVLVRRLKEPRLHALCSSLHGSLVDGRSFSSALRDYPRIFSPLYVNMVSAGEASGALSTILRRLVTHLGQIKDMRDRVTQALVYPAILVVAGIGMIILFMVKMVPQVTGFVSETGGTLPLPTQILLDANRLFVGWWWLGAAILACAYAALGIVRRSPAGRRAWDRFLLRIPGYGSIVSYQFYAQFARTLGTLIENGVTLLRALDLLEDISGNEYIRTRMTQVRAAVEDGASLSNALRPHAIFPEMFLDMMSVGEQTGRFGETMVMIADVYERELTKKVQITSALIPPLIMIVIAVLVGMVVFGILSAVFNVTQGLRGSIH